MNSFNSHSTLLQGSANFFCKDQMANIWGLVAPYSLYPDHSALLLQLKSSRRQYKHMGISVFQ